LAHAGEREGFIPVPQLFCAREGFLRKACRALRIATNRLQWNPKEKRMPPAESFCQCFFKFHFG
jgi:hypothetical protein